MHVLQYNYLFFPKIMFSFMFLTPHGMHFLLLQIYM